jgi:PTH1 family peptidyl-tRNA hydrolase
LETTSPWLIAGLGNPGAKYERTWHNAGFLTLEFLAQKNKIRMDRIKFKGVYGMGTIKGEKVILLKPATFMNQSGESIREAMTFFKIPQERILLVYDDIDIERGTIKIRKTGSAGTHNGMRSVISHLDTQDFPRIRVGIGPLPPQWQIVDFVLSEIVPEHQKTMFSSFEQASGAAEAILEDGVAAAMNRFNGKEKESEKEKEIKKDKDKAIENEKENRNEREKDIKCP